MNREIFFSKMKMGNIVQFEFWRFIKKARNESFKSRQIEGRVKQSKEYMELMEEFQKAFNELQEPDNHPHRLGEPEEQPNQSEKYDKRRKQNN